MPMPVRDNYLLHVIFFTQDSWPLLEREREREREQTTDEDLMMPWPTCNNTLIHLGDEAGK